jgi:uncharacterized membrane protein
LEPHQEFINSPEPITVESNSEEGVEVFDLEEEEAIEQPAPEVVHEVAIKEVKEVPQKRTVVAPVEVQKSKPPKQSEKSKYIEQKKEFDGKFNFDVSH